MVGTILLQKEVSGTGATSGTAVNWFTNMPTGKEDWYHFYNHLTAY